VSEVKNNAFSRIGYIRFGVKLRRTQSEQMSSGLPLMADIGVWPRRWRKTPGRSLGVTPSHRRSVARYKGRPSPRAENLA
jgi:hypothetical protein